VPAPGPAQGVWAILVAAGRGERLGLDQPKAFAKLGDEPLLAEPLRRLDESEWIDAIVVVAPPGWEEPAILLAEELGCSKANACVGGGETRSDSVRAGLSEVPEDALVVLVHDAARPLVSDAVIARVLGPLSEGWDGAVPGLPVSDTLKLVAPDGAVIDTVSRDGLYAVQTPQAFRTDVLRRAAAAGAEATDCAGLVQSGGGRVKVVEGDPRLLKVTTADDLAKIAAWL
jgi:2-C-methyl-D-erythritol 4-phosphate cytidylyltransferase